MSQRRQQGYLMVDHRASPGLTEDVSRALGYDPKLTSEGKLYEADTMTCAHCKCVVVKNPNRLRARHYCMKCGGEYICDGCAFKATQADYIHTPFVAVVENHLRQAALGSPSSLILPPAHHKDVNDGS
jgi:hypothetical protein